MCLCVCDRDVVECVGGVLEGVGFVEEGEALGLAEGTFEETGAAPVGHFAGLYFFGGWFVCV